MVGEPLTKRGKLHTGPIFQSGELPDENQPVSELVSVL